jgi:hypothetical protein
MFFYHSFLRTILFHLLLYFKYLARLLYMYITIWLLDAKARYGGLRCQL